MSVDTNHTSLTNTDTERKVSSIPAIALQITRKNGDRFLEACAELKQCLDRTTRDADRPQPLHEQIFAALSAASEECRHTSHTVMYQYLEHLHSSSLSEVEKKAATLLFHESDKSAKLGHLFAALSADENKTLTRSGLISLFRTILTSITLTLQSSDHLKENSGNGVIVEGQPSKPSSPERPSKRSKFHHGDGTVSTQDETEEDDSRMPCQSPSWDSSLATLRDEDDHSGMKKEIQDVATFAADDVLKYAAKNNQSLSLSEEKKSLAGAFVDFALFSSWYNSDGGAIVPWIELLQQSKWKAPSKSNKVDVKDSSVHVCTSTDTETSPRSLTTEDDKSRTLVSFDFTGAGSLTPTLVKISEDNLIALQELVHRTQLIQRSASDVCKLLLQAGTVRHDQFGSESMILRKDDFRRALRSIIPDYAYLQLKPEEQASFDKSFDDFFAWFENGKYGLHQGEVSLKEFAVGFSFLCAGNKSTKLAAGFELLDDASRGYLTEDQLLRYLQSYLTMLVGMSLLRPVEKLRSHRPVTAEKRQTMQAAIENGAKWTLGHFLRSTGKTKKNEYTFEKFASWYSKGGYNTAPWLELLDLGKVMALIGENGSPNALPGLETSQVLQTTERRPRVRDRVSSLRRHHLSRNGLPPEILFTFPLGNRRSLVVLKDDATYVRAVVEKLGLLTMKPDVLWSALSVAVAKRRPPSSPSEVAIYVNMDTFVQSMQDIIRPATRKRPNPDSIILNQVSSTVDELLANFYLCFDIDQCDSVALDELMGGLTLLCGGKKSHKLAFAFSIFDTRPEVHNRRKKGTFVHSLSGEDLFLFLRSILIVTFSTCRQSLDLTDEMVGRCIADTANMICNDVMRHQWESKRLDRLNFDEFGQWYNDGGFERAPWLELLDLRKWVLIDDVPPNNNQIHRLNPAPSSTSKNFDRKPPPIASVPSHDVSILPDDPTVPPPPPEDALDTNFFDTDALMPMDSMDDMDMILMQPSTDKDDFPKISKSFSFSPRQNQPPPVEARPNRNPLKFHLNTTDNHGGYLLSVSQTRIKSFRHLLESCGLNLISTETACNHILSRGSRTRINKKEFDEAVRLMLTPLFDHDRHLDQLINDVFSGIFAAFDRECKNDASALEVACGLTVLCRGKKSDKLEFAFEVLDKNKRGRLSTTDMASYLQSFLSVLLSIAFSPSLENDPIDDTIATMNGWRCDRTTATLIQAAKAGADWATSLAFRDFERNTKQAPSMSFDDFADWYTAVGYSSIPWLELLDLQKWAFTSEAK